VGVTACELVSIACGGVLCCATPSLCVSVLSLEYSLVQTRVTRFPSPHHHVTTTPGVVVPPLSAPCYFSARLSHSPTALTDYLHHLSSTVFSAVWATQRTASFVGGVTTLANLCVHAQDSNERYDVSTSTPSHHPTHDMTRSCTCTRALGHVASWLWSGAECRRARLGSLGRHMTSENPPLSHRFLLDFFIARVCLLH
jgi:hypothetical protein